MAKIARQTMILVLFRNDSLKNNFKFESENLCARLLARKKSTIFSVCVILDTIYDIQDLSKPKIKVCPASSAWSAKLKLVPQTFLCNQVD